MKPSKGIFVLLIPAAVFAVLLWASKWVVLENRRADAKPAITQITNSLGLDRDPSFSLDGKRIAYSSDRSGSFEVYVDEAPITCDGQQNVEPSWSPDGQIIVYTSEARKGIFVVPAVGGPSQRLTNFGSHPSWSPDGGLIAFRSGNAPENIWIVSAQGGATRQVTEVNHPEGAHGSPAWHPDSLSILFASQIGEVWSVRVREGFLTKVLKETGTHLFPNYSADARNVLYVGATAKGFSVMRTVVVDGRTVDLLALGAELPQGMAIDRIGRRAAYSLKNIYVAELPR